MIDQESSYKQIMKATSIFGGVKFLQIIIQIIKSKVVALLLGPSGMGVIELIISGIAIITKLTNFGLSTSAVKNIAEASATENPKKISYIVAIFRKLVWITGLLGALTTLLFSSLLSQFSFGNQGYKDAFVWLSITLLLNQLSSGQTVILQGLRKLKYLAKASLLGSFFSLIFTIPLYYYYGEKGIIPVIILTSIITLFLTWFYSRRVKIEKVRVDLKETFFKGGEMLKMGFLISFSGLLSASTSFVLRTYIGKTGGIDDVGLYSAGFAIIGTYVGLIFSAMGTDYYPRLAAVSNDNNKSRVLINQQSEVALIILAPILVVFLIFIEWIIAILYSTKFVSINSMIYWAALGMFFKTLCWSVGFIFLAKGKSKIFFFSELSINLVMLILNILGYYYGGLTGLGISYLLSYVLYLLLVYLIAKNQFNFSFNFGVKKIFIVQFSISVLCLFLTLFFQGIYKYLIGVVLIGISILNSYKELEKRIELKKLLKRKQ